MRRDERLCRRDETGDETRRDETRRDGRRNERDETGDETRRDEGEERDEIRRQKMPGGRGEVVPIGAAKKEQQRRRRKKKHVPKYETDEERQRRLRRLEDKRRQQRLEDKRREDEAERADRRASSGVEIGLNDSDLAIMQSPSWANQMERDTDEITTVILIEEETNAVENILDKMGNDTGDPDEEDEKHEPETMLKTEMKTEPTTTTTENMMGGQRILRKGCTECVALHDCITKGDKEIAVLRTRLMDVERTKEDRTRDTLTATLRAQLERKELHRKFEQQELKRLRTELKHAAARITQLEETVTTLRAVVQNDKEHERRRVNEIADDTEPEKEPEPEPEPQPDLTYESTSSGNELRPMEELQQTAVVIANVANTSEKIRIYERLRSVGRLLTEVNKDATEQERVRIVEMLLNGTAEGDLHALVCLVNIRGVQRKIKEDDGKH